MSLISEKIKVELDCIVNIARNHDNHSIGESLFFDVMQSIKADASLIAECKQYIEDNNVEIRAEAKDIEDIDESVDRSAIFKPYDASNIDISPKQPTINNIIERLANDEIDLMPDFQRRAGLWSEQQKSQLIESLILRIPLPAFYFDGSKDEKWIVIDGLQRLSALKAFFVDKSLKLSDLEFHKDLNGASFDDMPRVYTRRMLETQVTTYIINPGAPINLKYNIFKRINTGGLRLEPQEIRHALYQGYATTYVKELSDLQLFKEATGYSIRTERMLDREFILRFIAFYEQKLELYNGAIELFLNDAMDIVNTKYDPTKNPGYSEGIKSVFENTLALSVELFGQFAFRRMPDQQKRRPLSKALFETWTSCLAKLTLDERSALKKNKSIFTEKYIQMNRDDLEFMSSLGSAKISSVRKRFESIQGLIKEAVKC